MSLPESFSEREKEVAALLLQGKSNKQIAQALGIATRTVEFHISNLYAKMGVTSRAEAILALSEPHLRETASAQMRESTGGNLRDSTVDTLPDPKENDVEFTVFNRRIRMKKLLFVIIVLIAGACLVPALGLVIYNMPVRQEGVQQITPAVEEIIPAVPTYTPWETPTPNEVIREVTQTPWVVATEPQPMLTAAPVQPDGGRYSFEGVSLTVDPAAATGLSGQVVLEKQPDPNGPFWDVNPQYVWLTLDGYPLTGTFHEPVISVYPVEEFRQLHAPAREAIDELAALLSDKSADPERIPFLPLVNASQVFRANVEYLDFENGSGVRWLTLLAQYPAPINNHELFYTFQGLTADGQHLVSVVMPVNHPSLPASADELSQSEMEAIWEDPDYYVEMADSLTAAANYSYTPDLSALDSLVGSIRINR